MPGSYQSLSDERQGMLHNDVEMCQCFWFMFWTAGLVLSWVYKVRYANSDDATIALCGAVLYSTSVTHFIPLWAPCSKIVSNNVRCLSDRCMQTFGLLTGILVPLAAGVLMAIAAARSSDHTAVAIAGTTAAVCFLALPVNWYLLEEQYKDSKDSKDNCNC